MGPLLRSEQEFWHRLVGQAYVRVLGQPEEIHPGHEDGVCWHQEGQGARGLDRVHENARLSCCRFEGVWVGGSMVACTSQRWRGYLCGVSPERRALAGAE